MNKPVWRMNTGNGVPSDANGTVYTPESVQPIDSLYVNLIRNSLWRLNGTLDICAYQTTRTKAAKYEWIDCQVCGGKGWRKLKDWITKRPFKGVCIYCDGKGYRLEYIK